MDLTGKTEVANNHIRSLFNQCIVTPNGTIVTQSIEHCIYRSYPVTLLPNDKDAAASHLTNTYWYLDTSDMQSYDPMVETHTAITNEVFIFRRTRLRGSRDVQLFALLHTDLCNVTLFMLPGVKLQI